MVRERKQAMPSSEFSNLDFGFRYGTLKEINNTIVFDGYRVYLNKNKRMKSIKENKE